MSASFVLLDDDVYRQNDMHGSESVLAEGLDPRRLAGVQMDTNLPNCMEEITNDGSD